MRASRDNGTRRALGAWLLLAGALFGMAGMPPAWGQPVPTRPAPFVLGLDAPPDSYPFRWLTSIYAEVFKRLGIPFQLESYALKRQGVHIEAGVIDGEAARAYGYGAAQPNLVRVDESVTELHLALYTAHPSARLQRLEELSSNGMQVDYRRGILLCENTLKPWVPPDHLSDVATYEQGIKKLMAGHTDAYCDFSVNVLSATHAPGIPKATGVRKLLDIGDAVPTYPYLHRKHADLAPRMAAVLKQMKAEGLIEAYRLQVEHEQGWGQ